eukprot:4355331-Pyramimonas_sp.AAC.1
MLNRRGLKKSLPVRTPRESRVARRAARAGAKSILRAKKSETSTAQTYKCPQPTRDLLICFAVVAGAL